MERTARRVGSGSDVRPASRNRSPWVTLTSVAKTKLRYVGNFVELGYDDDPNAPCLVTSRGKRVRGNKDQVVAYLRSATTLIFSPGSDDDIFEPQKRAGSASVMTDGVYVWPKTLAYYVENYDAELPAEFEDHMERRGWKPLEGIDKLAMELPRPS